MKNSLKKNRHHFQFIILIASAIFFMSCQNGNGAAKALSPAAFKAKMEKDTGTVVIDVRTSKEFAEGHLPGAINFNVNDETFTEKISTLDSTGTYMIYCRSGNRTIKAEEIMRANGIKNIIQMKGGFPDWAKEGLPVEKETVPE